MCFTTLRLSNAYNVGDQVEIVLKDNHIQDGVILGKKELRLNQVSDFIGYLDTGYSGLETQEILKKMYGAKVTDWQNQPLYLYLIKSDKK